jgi:hypothetical protein
VRLPAVAITSLFPTMTQPIGTSPAFPALSAAFSAKSMKEGAVNGSFPAQNSATELHSAKVDTGFA